MLDYGEAVRLPALKDVVLDPRFLAWGRYQRLHSVCSSGSPVSLRGEQEARL
jgi:hypothetical protein